MRPVFVALLAITLAILPACGGLEYRPATKLREVVFTLPDTAHNKLASRMAEFARDHQLRFEVPRNLMDRELTIEMWRGFMLLTDMMIIISNSPPKPETAFVRFVDGPRRRAPPGDIESMSRSLENALVEVPGVHIVSAKTCPC